MRRGLTLVELLLVVAIVGLLTAIGFPRLSGALRRATVRNAAQHLVAAHTRARLLATVQGRVILLTFHPDSLTIQATRQPTERARTLPGRVYHDPAVFGWEHEQWFRRDWLLVGREEDAPETGSFFRCEVAGAGGVTATGPFELWVDRQLAVDQQVMPAMPDEGH